MQASEIWEDRSAVSTPARWAALDKGTPAARRGRKARGLSETARSPKEPRQPCSKALQAPSVRRQPCSDSGRLRWRRCSWRCWSASVTRGPSRQRGATGAVAAQPPRSPRAVAACRSYKRAKRHLQRTRRSFAARAARTHPRARRAKLRRAHRVRTARRVGAPAAAPAHVRACARRANPGTRRFAAPAPPGPGCEPPAAASAGACTPTAGAAARRDRSSSTACRRWASAGSARSSTRCRTARADTLYANAARRGLRILPLLQKSSALPADVNEYANVVAAFARRYGPGGDFWSAHPELDASLASTHFEVYNEPYGDWYGPVEPARFAALLRTVVPRARQANPQARFLIAVDRTPDGERHTWIDDLYGPSPASTSSSTASRCTPTAATARRTSRTTRGASSRIVDAHSALQSHGAGDKEFWITEVGWSTCPRDPQWCVTEAQQAAYMERLAAARADALHVRRRGLLLPLHRLRARPEGRGGLLRPRPRGLLAQARASTRCAASPAPADGAAAPWIG